MIINLPKEVHNTFPYEIFYKNHNLSKMNISNIEKLCKKYTFKKGVKSLTFNEKNELSGFSSPLDVLNNLCMIKYDCFELSNNTLSIHIVESYMRTNYDGKVNCICLN